MSFFFDENKPTSLCEIMGRNKSDKGDLNITESHHNYTTFYYSIFKDIADKELRIFELGLGTNDITINSNMGVNGRPGASLYGWSEFFKNSQIFGADIDKKILFNTDRIHTFYCDQTNPDVIKNMWDNEELLQDKFDIIIEDGLHEVNANVCFFENSIHKLKTGGYYIIEDIITCRKNIYENIIKNWEVKFPYNLYELLTIPSQKNKFDNNLIVVYKKGD
jgi:SAM-dependent methyltransferase